MNHQIISDRLESAKEQLDRLSPKEYEGSAGRQLVGLIAFLRAVRIRKEFQENEKIFVKK